MSFSGLIKLSSAVHWMNSYSGAVPAGAVVAGFQNGQLMYVCRAWEDGELLPGLHNHRVIITEYKWKFDFPGKLDTRHGGCFVPFRGREEKRKYYEVAVGIGIWLPFRGGSFPVDAFQGGMTRLGEILYVCRARIDGHLISGKLHPSHGGCYIANASREHKVNLYEVLVY